MARNTRELAQRPAVDPREEPSAEWGWHGSFPKGKWIAGGFSVVFLLLMIPVNPHPMSFTEIAWLVGPALVIVVGLAVEARRKRHAWRK